MEKKTSYNLQQFKVTNFPALKELEKRYRSMEDYELYPWANNTSYKEIATHIIADRDGGITSPLFMTISMHRPTHGISNLCNQAEQFIKSVNEENGHVVTQPLSISARIQDGQICLITLVRQYEGEYQFVKLFSILGDDIIKKEEDKSIDLRGHLVIPDEIKNFHYEQDVLDRHKKALQYQKQFLKNATKEKPYLNQLTEFIPDKLPTPADKLDLTYDLKTSDMQIKTVMPYEEFNKVFNEIMNYVSGVEYYHYVNVMKKNESQENFLEFLRTYVMDSYVKTGKFKPEDVEILMKKLHRALFQFYVLQDLIDDPDVTDIHVTSPDSIRCRVKGLTYLSNITFVDANDYRRFVNGIAIKNDIRLDIPEQTFTVKSDENYILRLTITAEYINSQPWPTIHLRKISKRKMLAPDLKKAGMFDDIIEQYLLQCGQKSRGIVFAGPPGSGKTIALNWFLEEAYEQSADILVIQENDELFSYRKGIRFQHVVNYERDNKKAVDLEELGRLALVAGANVFVIGEAKGAEICSAITLSNSGCRTAITIHSNSSTDTIDKMADLAMRGYAKDIVQAKRMIKTFQTIVYMEGFKIREISEIIGFNEETHDMEYRYIYRDPSYVPRGELD